MIAVSPVCRERLGTGSTLSLAHWRRIRPCSKAGAQRRTFANDAQQTIFNYRKGEDGNRQENQMDDREGPLSSWTVSIKDNICTKDMPTTCSSKMLESYISPFEATSVGLLRQAGAQIIGKTNCDEFGMGSMNLDSAFGPIVNPMTPHGMPDRVAGGSSGGAAASVAGKYCRIAIGSDTGGSIRLPAAYCGVYGLKPSYGLISRWGLISYADSLDTIGIFASDHDDVRTTFNVLAKFDENDPTSISNEVRKRAEGTSERVLMNIGKHGNLKGLRIGIPQEVFAKEVHSRVLPSIRQTLTKLRQLGADLFPIHLPNIKYALSAYYVLATAEASSNLARFDGIRYGHRSDQIKSNTDEKGVTSFAKHIAKTRSEAFGKEVKKRLLLGTYSLTSELFDNYFLQAQRVRQLIRNDFNKALCIENVLQSSPDPAQGSEGVHAILHPSAVDIAPLLTDANKTGLEAYTQDLLTVPASLAGLPAINVPAGRAEGMPVGITLTTQWGCEPILWRILENLGP